MKSFSSRQTSGRGAAHQDGRRLCAPGAALRWPIAALLCAFAVIVGAPSSFADPSPDPDLAQSVAAHEEWSNEASEISVGHVDLGPRLIDGQWRAGLRHDAESGAVWRDPNQTVLRVNDAAIMTAPDSADYPFLADVAGKPVYVVPQTQNPSVVWLGWNTQDPAVTATIDRGLTMRIGPVSGPGRAWLFLQSGTFGKPLLLADSGAAPGDVWIDSGTHVHANWAFSAPGTYTATVTFLARPPPARPSAPPRPCASPSVTPPPRPRPWPWPRPRLPPPMALPLLPLPLGPRLRLPGPLTPPVRPLLRGPRRAGCPTGPSSRSSPSPRRRSS